MGQVAARARVLVLLPLLFTAACAGVRSTPGENFAEGMQLARPPVLVVYDFAISADDLAADLYGEEFAVTEDSTDREIESARRYARTLSEQVVETLNSRGIDAKWSDDKSAPPLDAIVLTGQFVSIDSGSRAKRLVIGFGAGSREMRVQVQAYQVTKFGLMRIVESEKEATGSRGFGLVVPVTVSAATGGVGIIAGIGASLIAIREVRTGGNADARRIAGAIADRAEEVYKSQGWL
jgi:hypothetical protein